MEVPEKFGETLRLVVEDDVSLPRLYLAFRSPVFGSDGYYAASVAGAVLGMRQGSRLYRSLVRERQIAADATAFTFDLAKGSDLLVVDVTARPETSAEKLEAEVEREIDALVENGVTAEEVERAVALIQTDIVTALQSASERADRLSMFATLLGNPALLNEQASRYSKVTAEQVSAFARERLGSDNRAKLLYVPRAASSIDSESEALEVAAS
jgi:predicted Zn-dependent peptidase